MPAVTVMVLALNVLSSLPAAPPLSLPPPKRLLMSPKMLLPVWNALAIPPINLPPAMIPAAATTPLWSFAIPAGLL